MQLETLETISHPSRLRPGAVIVRVRRGGEVIWEESIVLGWESPAPPPAGQPWPSGFLRVNRDGAVSRIGPASVIKADFRQVKQVRDGVPPKAKKPGREAFWWNRD